LLEITNRFPARAFVSSDGIHQIVIKTLSGFICLCLQLAYKFLSGIFLIASKLGESLLRSYQQYPAKSASKLGESIYSYQEYPANSVGKQQEEFLIVALVINFEKERTGQAREKIFFYSF
jgi:hypothetical protein